MSAEQPQPAKCLVPKCEEKARWKGICGKCYHQAKELIAADKTTWEQLAEMGLCVYEEKKLLTAFLKKRGEPLAGRIPCQLNDGNV